MTCGFRLFNECDGTRCPQPCTDRKIASAIEVVDQHIRSGRLERLLVAFAVGLSLAAAGYAGGKIIRQGVENVRNVNIQHEVQ